MAGSKPSSSASDIAARKRRIRFALTLGAAALFMFVSFIIKTAVKGP